jgi:phage terminase small subunit
LFGCGAALGNVGKPSAEAVGSWGGMALSAKQRKFVNEYLIDGNATRAAERAGYKGDENTLAVTGYENLRNPKIAEAISRRTSESAMPAEEVLKRLADQARSSMADFAKVDEKGQPYFDLNAAQASKKLHLVKKLKVKARTFQEHYFNPEVGDLDKRDVTETTFEFELYDAQSALTLLGKHHRLFADKLDVHHSGSVDFTADEAAQAAKELTEWQRQQSSQQP